MPFSADAGGGTGAALYFYNDFLHFGQGATTYRVTSALYRDTSSWYHIVLVLDTTDATASDRVKMYVNGDEITAFSSSSDPALNSDLAFNNNVAHAIGADIPNTGARNFFDGYMAEVNFIDGTALDVTSFGETINGIWVPKRYSGSYGTNGFYLSFADSSAIGDDLSGNTNDWTANNLAASDVVSDSPTNSFCTLNPLTHGTFPTLSEGNLKIASVYSADLSGVASTWYPTTGKWYWEVHNEGATSTYPYLGITDQRQTMTNATKGSFYSVAWLRNGNVASMTGTNTYMGTITTNTVTSWTNDDIIMFALDVDARKLWVGKNGTWDGSGDPAAGSGEDASWTVDTGVSPSFMGYAGQGLNSVFNFGQDGTFAGNQTAQGNADENGVGDFYYSPPSSFLAMATANIEDGAISPNSEEQADDYFGTILYTAATSNGTYTHGNLSFRPDFSWIKNRNNVESHFLIDSVRGNESVFDKFLRSNATSAEGANGTSGTTFSVTDTGYEFVEVSINSGELYFNNRTYVGWNWKAGGTAVSNTDGSITSSVSAAPEAGFSIVSWTGTGSAITVGHGLGVTPSVIIIKNRDGGDNADPDRWYVWHQSFSNTSRGFLRLNDTIAEGASSVIWNDTAPTSSVFSMGSAYSENGSDFIAYCFADVDSYLKCGSYVGNGNADGTFVYTGFRPAWVMIKRTDFVENWWMFDNKRSPFNVVDKALIANDPIQEISNTSIPIDVLSNGFKLRNNYTGLNASGGTFIYLAIGEASFKYSNAR
jgi:hypothetical protein